MTHPLLSALNSRQQRQLFHDIYYLNMRELLRVCKKFKIPMRIWFEVGEGENKRLKASSLADRKKVLLRRLVHLLKTDKILKKTIFPSNVVKLKEASCLKPNDIVYYGQYKNGSKVILCLMKKLTKKKFKFGSVAQEILLQAWTKGVRLTYRQFARLWLRRINSDSPHPEWAYLHDLKKGIDMTNWKEDRERFAKRALGVLGVK